ncbi:MAG TPA: protein kinase, partial [Ktedonobacteraceae bacterium]|nr:protein kinase [Ktedonobacteraceae bacterium]
NMLLNQQGQVLLSDFGIAMMVLSSTLHSAQSFFVGTIPYMAPEQAGGHPCLASDQYALAVVVYEWICGQRPFHGSPIEIAIQHRVSPPPSLCEQNQIISPEVEQVVLTALAKDPIKRFASVKAFAQALETACSASSILTDVSAPSTMLDITPSRTPTSMPVVPDLVIGAGPAVTELSSLAQAIDRELTGKLPSVATAIAGTAQFPAIPIQSTTPQQDNTGTTVVIAGPASVVRGVDAMGSLIRIGSLALLGAIHRKNLWRDLISAVLVIAHKVGVMGSLVRSGNLVLPGAIPRKNRWGSLIAAVLIVAILLIVSGMVISAIGTIVPTIITITPDSQVEHDRYVIQAVTGRADLAKRQVSLRQLTFSSQKQSKSVTATGVGYIKATRASGTLIFYNGSTTNLLVEAGTRVQSSNGIWVITDQFVDVPARLFGNFVMAVSVPAHAVYPGNAGNIRALAINQFCCNFSNSIEIKNPKAFSGGLDVRTYTFLQQSDVDGVVNHLKPVLSQLALNDFKRQIKSNEQLVGEPQCTMEPNVDQPVGDHWLNITSANVTVKATCTGLAYDASGAQMLAQALLKRKAVSDLGQSYTLAGTITTKPRVTNTDTKNQIITINVEARGVWYYQFDDQQKQTLAKYLINKSRADAQRFLTSYTGISKAKIDITGGGNTLPANPKQIGIKVLEV